MALIGTHEVRARTVEDADLTFVDCCPVVTAIQSLTRGFDTVEGNGGIIDEIGEHSDRIGTTADTGDDCVGKSPGHGEHLCARLGGNDAVEFTNDRGEGVRAGCSSQEIVGGRKSRCPVAQGLVDGVLEGTAARSYRNDGGAHELHSFNIGCLTNNVNCAHVDRAFQAEECADHCGCGAVLASPCFSDDARLSHALGK